MEASLSHPFATYHHIHDQAFREKLQDEIQRFNDERNWAWGLIMVMVSAFVVIAFFVGLLQKKRRKIEEKKRQNVTVNVAVKQQTTMHQRLRTDTMRKSPSPTSDDRSRRSPSPVRRSPSPTNTGASTPRGSQSSLQLMKRSSGSRFYASIVARKMSQSNLLEMI